MVLGLRIGGMAATAVTALLTLLPGQPTPAGSQLAAQNQEADDALTPLVEGSEEYSEGYQSPVEAEVVDYFRPPAHVGAPGNRGLEYDPEPGQPVWASAEGEVLFAGSVANNRFVTVLHHDGLRTAYGYLGWIAVAKGDWVEAGQLLGTTSDRFFFSVRAGEVYLDPVRVLAVGHVRLVPHQESDPDQALLVAES